MQLSGNNNQIHGTKSSPPPPMVQTSVSANHSRNVSQSSGISETQTAAAAPIQTPTQPITNPAAL